MPYRTCVKCSIPLYPKKNGAYLVVMAGDPPRPYQIWGCDIHACRRCKMEVATGFSIECHEEWESGFAAAWERLKANEKAVIVYQYERLSDAERHGQNPPDVPVGLSEDRRIVVQQMTKEDLDEFAADSPYGESDNE